MSFINPLGLLGLLAIPLLILIYIIKNKYTEQTVSSTYLWSLSERFLKRKNPINRINGLLSLILQLLAVIFISVTVAKPVFTLKGVAQDYLFVLDASGSMQMEQEGVTRFERGKSEIRLLIEEAKNGSCFTLICEGETTDRVYEKITDKRTALNLLDGVEVSCSAMSKSSVNALNVTQTYFTENASVQAYLFTDKAFEETKNVRLVNLSSGEENYAVSDVKYERNGEMLTVRGEAWSYENDATVSVSLYVNGGATPLQTKEYAVKKLEGTAIEFTCEQAEFSSVELVIENGDALPLDNRSTVYNVKSDTRYKSVVVTDGSPLFWKSAISALGNINVEVMTTEEYEASTQVFGLYLFDSYTPAQLPRESAVWFLNPQQSLNELDNVGFTVSQLEDFGNDLENEVITSWAHLTYNTSTSSVIEGLLANTRQDEIALSAYRRCEMERDFHELLYCKNDPVLFAGTNGYGNRQVVFAFDVHDSDFPVTYDFSVLTYNLLNYTFPEIIEETSFYCGETLSINVLPNCDSIRIQSPSGKITYPSVNVDVVEYEITEAGVYTITLVGGETETVINVYGNLPLSERFPTVTETQFSVIGEAKEEGRDGIYDDLLIYFIILAVLIVADWGVYCYEQYQLR